MRPPLRTRARRRRLWHGVSAITAGVLGCAGLAAIAAAPASAATNCQINYSKNDWGTGFVATIVITNTGDALSSWTLTYSYTGNQTLSNGWSGNWTQSGKNVTVTNASWNGAVPSGGTVTFGAQFAYTGTNTDPTSFAVNGVTCGGGGGTPPPTSPPPTSPPPTSPPPTSPPPTSPPPTSPPPTSPPPTSPPPPGETLLVNPSSFSVAQGTSDVFGVALSTAPTGSITVNVARTAGNTGLSVSSGATLTFTPSNWNYAQPVTVTADSAGTGNATFTVSSSGVTSVTTTGSETGALTGTTATHTVNPFTGSTWFDNPDYSAEVAAAAASASGTLAAQMKVVGQQSTGVWLDRIGAIYGGTLAGNRMSLEAEMRAAVSQESGSTPILLPLVIYDLPNRDCAALASNGELTVSNNGLNVYEHQYIDPIAQILSNFTKTGVRVVAIIEPDSLPNLVTNTNISACAQAQSSGAYVSGVQYALNKLHAIPNVYNYVDIAHSGWLGWPNNMNAAVPLLHSVAAGTTAGTASVDGFISNTANYTPTTEPFMTATQNVDGNPVNSVVYYSFDPFIDELTYDQQMYSQLVSSGFSANIGMLIDTSRNGWGGPNRPSGACTNCTTTDQFVNSSKVDQRVFRGNWCNQNNSGIGALPQANPNSSFSHLYAYVWIKPPGESDGDYPTATHSHGDPHCDPNSTNSDGSGHTFNTGAIPGFDVPAGQFFTQEFTMLIQNANPAIP